MSSSTKPNVLLITTDHWSAPLPGAAGDFVIQAPTLDHLSAVGTRKDGKLVGLPETEFRPTADRNFSGQRGSHWPMPKY